MNYISIDKAYDEQHLNNFFSPHTSLNYETNASYESSMDNIRDKQAKKIIDINHKKDDNLCNIHMDHISRCDVCALKLKKLIQQQIANDQPRISKKNKINAIIVLIILLMVFIAIYSMNARSNFDPHPFEVFMDEYYSKYTN